MLDADYDDRQETQVTPNAVLDFILNLLRDEKAAAAYCTDPAQSLAAAGLSGVCAADISAVAPMVAESAVAGSGVLSAVVNAGSGVAGVSTDPSLQAGGALGAVAGGQATGSIGSSPNLGGTVGGAGGAQAGAHGGFSFDPSFGFGG